MHFLIPVVAAAPTAALITLNFDPYYTPLSPQLKQGQSVKIEYDLQRAKCPHAYYKGVDTWTVTVFYAFNNNFTAIQQQPIAYTNVGFPMAYERPIIENLPQGKLSMWFLCSSELGTTYDSDYGRNYNFNIQ
ncbi:hypothetical protein EDD86DRAFT_276117 [Gorgonomyces haynaldii]|nr:hypothetical protein EDD86DRAFT_276117 [Gorgonomyces haynaldii]